MNFYTDSSEWRWLFKNAIDWDTLLPLYYPTYPTPDGFNSKEEVLEFFEQLLTQTGEWAGDTIWPRARELDEVGSGKLKDGVVEISEPLKKTYQEATQLGFHGMAVDRELGGMGAPVAVAMMAFEQVSRACNSTSTQLGFFSSIADMLERFCDKETQAKFIPRILAGELSGSMCLTEPDVGSDLANLRTTAVKQTNGSYLLNGSKRFITNASGGLAFILAKIPGGPEGLKGISIFLAEQHLPDGKLNFKIEKVEEKLGLHGSMTCEVFYDNTVAHLVGKEHEGFAIMLNLMNAARISVGLQSVGGIDASLRVAREYAEQREAFGRKIIDLPLYKRNFTDWETERDAFRALMADTITWFDVVQRLELKKQHTGELNEDETKLFNKAKRITRHRTPLVKYYGAETYTLLSQRAIQALGGYGFMKEYDPERLHRDSFGPLLYEGTSQIQALMSMKDFVAIMFKNPARFVQSIFASHPLGNWVGGDEFTTAVSSVKYEFRKNVAALLLRTFMPGTALTESSYLDTVFQLNKLLKPSYWREPGKIDRLMTHAETLCQALSYFETLKILGKHASKDSTRADLFRRYLRLIRPRLAGIYADWT